MKLALSETLKLKKKLFLSCQSCQLLQAKRWSFAVTQSFAISIFTHSSYFKAFTLWRPIVPFRTIISGKSEQLDVKVPENFSLILKKSNQRKLCRCRGQLPCVTVDSALASVEGRFPIEHENNLWKPSSRVPFSSFTIPASVPSAVPLSRMVSFDPSVNLFFCPDSSLVCVFGPTRKRLTHEVNSVIWIVRSTASVLSTFLSFCDVVIKPSWRSSVSGWAPVVFSRLFAFFTLWALTFCRFCCFLHHAFLTYRSGLIKQHLVLH